MNSRNILKAIFIVSATYFLPILLGLYLHSENPQGLILYTALPDGKPPKYTPSFPFGTFVGLIGTSILSALLVTCGAITAYFARNNAIAYKAKYLAKIGVIVLAASLVGVITCGVHL